MRADVLLAQALWGPAARFSLFSYTVPPALVEEIAAGQLVSAPFGERSVVGVVWALDASDEIAADASPDDLTTRNLVAESRQPTRTLGSILLREPVLLPTQRALAEWLAAYYSAPLHHAVRLMLPPGLLRTMRSIVRPLPATELDPDVSDDAAVVLTMARERGAIDRAEVERVLGLTRARAALRALLAKRLVAVVAEVAPIYAGMRRARVVRLTATEETLTQWRAQARATLDATPTLDTSVAGRARRARGTRVSAEQRGERLLRQLAVLDVLCRHDPAADELGGWKLEELQRLTRVTPAALAELAAAELVTVREVDVRHDPFAGRSFPQTEPLTLTPVQQTALATILQPAANRGAGPPRACLLHGITGSGKTEIYLQALAATIAEGRRGIVLVPEIALTPQAMARFAGRFPGRVALLHSGLTDAERLDEWRRIRAGEVDVVLGSRSALFAPVSRLGLIVVDEEHEAAYKEEQRAPTYHARDVAVQLGKLARARVVLGSATPSVESYWRASQGEYTLVELRERAPTSLAGAAQLPVVDIIDLRAELRGGNTSILSESLRNALTETLQRGEQAILFLNRRGTASAVMCRECGYAVVCGHCDVGMTFHATESEMVCHYCGRREKPPAVCPVCWSASIRYFGLGTERVEAAVKRQFPQARVLRWDRDTARTRQAHEDLLRAFAERRADVLVGTQMIAKGLDLPAVTLVGVVSADIALFLPDFRASERAFQLLTQVAGRAGRGEKVGRVLIQSFNPDHFCIQSAARHDYQAFVAAELVARQQYRYPPFRRFAKCVFEHADRYAAQLEATALSNRMERLIASSRLADTDIVGPAPAFMERLRGRYRWQFILRGADLAPLLSALHSEELTPGWSIDLDPVNSM